MVEFRPRDIPSFFCSLTEGYSQRIINPDPDEESVWAFVIQAVPRPKVGKILDRVMRFIVCQTHEDFCDYSYVE